MERIINNIRKNSQYISYRVNFLFCGIFLFETAQIVYNIYRYLHTGEMLFMIIFECIMLCIFLQIYFRMIRSPYVKSEKMLKRFLDGYLVSDYKEIDIPFLTPNTEHELKKMDEILSSPQIFELNKRQAQYLALQNQINPHFLYNTLESIRGEALIAGLDSVADMTEALATFFRYTISKVENLVSVDEELSNCKNYFRIQQYRFGSRLKLHIECDKEDWDEISHCRIPKLTLQPIVENAIIHGTELKIGEGNITISFVITEKRLIIRISDDGIGMDEDVLNKLNKRLGKDSQALSYKQTEEKGGIALVNVNNRIHILFGEEYGIHVYSIKGEGTDVEISIPAVQNDREIKNRGIF